MTQIESGLTKVCINRGSFSKTSENAFGSSVIFEFILMIDKINFKTYDYYQF